MVLLGGDSLAGREVRERLSETSRVRLEQAAAGDNVSAVLSADEEEDEANVISALSIEQMAEARVVVFAGQSEEAHAGFAELRKNGSRAAIVDVTGELEQAAPNRVRAPHFESGTIDRTLVHSIPHAASYVLAHFLHELQNAQEIRRAVATIFEPASASGRKAVDELQRQAISLLTFKPVPKDVFDAQLAFNFLVRPGEEATIVWKGREQRIERDLASLLAIESTVPMPSIRLIQAPVFHGYAISLWVEFAQTVRLESMKSALRAAGVDLRDDDLDPPDNVGSAGESGYAVGGIEPDRNDSRGCWFWLAADNFRTVADITVDVVQELL